jgi:hypothetical protein
LDEHGQLVLVKGRVTVFVDEPEATSFLKFVGMIDVIPWIVPSRTSLQNFSTLGLPKDFERHEIQ